jgi:small subunit ribosomal protein S21
MMPEFGDAVRPPKLGDRLVIVLEPGMPLDVALKRSKRAYETAGLAAELRRRQSFESPGGRRRRKHRAALKRAAKRVAWREPDW